MIEYRSQSTSSMNDGYSEILREASEYFAGQRVHMIGNGFDEILSEQSLFDTYVDKLSKGLSADEAVEVQQLLENSRTAILRESSISGIQPIAALSMPTVRKMWVKVALKNALPTEAVKAPKFAVSYMEPYLLDGAGVKHPLPSALRNMSNSEAELQKLAVKKIVLKGTPDVMPVDLFAGITGTPTKAKGDTIDPKFLITSVTVNVTGKDAATGVTDTVYPVVVPVRKELDLRSNIVFEVTAKKDVTFTGGANVGTTASTTATDTIFCTVDKESGKLNATSIKDLVVEFTIDGKLTSENNLRGESVSFDIKTKDITIGAGVHLNAPLPIEWLQDSMAMYQIDGALEVVDIMSNVFAQKLDQEILNYLDASYVNAGAQYTGNFSIKPNTSFAGSPKDWREELKTVIDFFAQKMKNDSAFSGGTFVLIGNPLDTNLITNVNWVFNSNTDERGGVEVDFNIGAYSGAQRYSIVSSVNVPQGAIRMIYIPSTPKQMTYKYYPYTFNVEKGYLDPNRPNVPSIMMTKRHTIEELTPLSAVINILDNNGSIGYTNQSSAVII